MRTRLFRPRCKDGDSVSRCFPRGVHRKDASGLVVLTAAAGLVLACGAGQGPAKEPASPTADAPVGAGADATGGSPSPAADLSATTTSTSTLAPAGEGKGTKLVERAGSGSSRPDAGAGPMPHEHDPGRGPADIRALVVAHRDEARACYDRALADHPGIEGDLVITWIIDPKGNVVQAAVDSSRSQISEPAVVDCVSAILKKLQFAPSPGGFETHASYPFNFRPHHTKKAE